MFLNKKEVIKKYPHLKSIEKSTIFATRDEFNNIFNYGYIYINNNNISIYIIEKILSDKNLFNYTYAFFTEKITDFFITYLDKENEIIIEISKQTIIDSINYLIEQKEIILNKKEEQRYKILKELSKINFNNFINEFKNQIIYFSVDYNYYEINLSNLINILLLDNELFEKKINENNIPKKHLLYIIKDFIQQYNILEKYVLPKEIIDRVLKIINNEYEDIESINILNETKEEIHNNININKELIYELIKDIPKHYNKIKQAIYVYIKLCKLLSYDPEYYINPNQDKKHNYIEYIESISLNNKNIVCYEFNLIYSKILNMLNINFESITEDREYADGHNDILFKVEKFLIKADSTTTILKGDLIRAKLNYNLNGLTCINQNQHTKEEFKSLLEEVYSDIKKEEVEKSNNIIFDININNLELKNKINTYLNQIVNFNLEEVDLIGSSVLLRELIFSLDEQNNNISIHIIKKTSKSLAAIIVINEINYNQNPEENIYYLLENNNLIRLTCEEIENKFETKQLSLIRDYNQRKIPGIDLPINPIIEEEIQKILKKIYRRD